MNLANKNFKAVLEGYSNFLEERKLALFAICSCCCVYRHA